MQQHRAIKSYEKSEEESLTKALVYLRKWWEFTNENSNLNLEPNLKCLACILNHLPHRAYVLFCFLIISS